MKSLATPASSNISAPVKEKKANISLVNNDDEKRRLARLNAEKRSKARTTAKRQQAAEGLSSATEELASGVNEATAASEQLSQAMEVITSGATQASSAAEQSMAAATQLEKNAALAATIAQQSLDKVDAIQRNITGASSDIDTLIEAISLASNKSVESTKIVEQLSTQAKEVEEVVNAVVEIADQTNLLALNAAVEAARAGEHGRGFAVVADEVRNLAEVAEKSATGISAIITEVQDDVKLIAESTEKAGKLALEEVEKGKAITEQLSSMEANVIVVQEGSTEINKLSAELATAIDQFKKGTEIIAAASEESSSAAHEATTTASEQDKALAEIQQTTDELAQMAEDLKVNTDSSKTSEELAANAENLSAAIEQANASSQQIMAAIKQIANGAEEQSSAAQQSSAALKQIETNTVMVAERGKESLEKVESLFKVLGENKKSVDQLVEGVKESAKGCTCSSKDIEELEKRISRIDAIVDQITTTALKTDMLAVNGGVEAARAGEFGKGFAVVAADIRSLATDSATNAEKIKSMVKEIKEKAAQVAKDILDNGLRAEQEVKNAVKTTDALNEIGSDMKEVLGGFSSINKSTEESVVATSQAAKGVQEIATAAEQSSSAAQQASTNAAQQAKGMQELAKAVEEISAMADELQN